MNLLMGLPILLLGLVVGVLAYINIKVKKIMSFSWGGYGLISFSAILISFGMVLVKTGI